MQTISVLTVHAKIGFPDYCQYWATSGSYTKHDSNWNAANVRLSTMLKYDQRNTNPTSRQWIQGDQDCTECISIITGQKQTNNTSTWLMGSVCTMMWSVPVSVPGAKEIAGLFCGCVIRNGPCVPLLPTGFGCKTSKDTPSLPSAASNLRVAGEPAVVAWALPSEERSFHITSDFCFTHVKSQRWVLLHCGEAWMLQGQKWAARQLLKFISTYLHSLPWELPVGWPSLGSAGPSWQRPRFVHDHCCAGCEGSCAECWSPGLYKDTDMLA